MKKRLLKVLATAVVIAASSIASAEASPITGTYVPLDSTTGTGPWTMTSTNSTDSLLRFVFDTPIKFQDMTTLSSAYTSVQSGITGGAPRFAIVVDTDNDNIPDSSFLILWGPAGSFVDPSIGPANTGNLLALTDVGRYDLGGIGGSAYTDRTAALALAGNFFVYRTTLILDSFDGNTHEFIIDGISADAADAVPESSSIALVVAALLSLLAFGLIRRRRDA